MQNKEIPHKQSGTNVCVITHVCNAHKLTAEEWLWETQLPDNTRSHPFKDQRLVTLWSVSYEWLECECSLSKDILWLLVHSWNEAFVVPWKMRMTKLGMLTVRGSRTHPTWHETSAENLKSHRISAICAHYSTAAVM